MPTPFVLASASPRRLEILRALGLEPEVAAVDIDESLGPGESPASAALRLARAKAAAAAARLGGARRLVIAADTLVALGDEALGKPRDQGEALAMIARLQGRTHEVHTGLALVDLPSARLASGLSTSRVCFAAMSSSETAWYAATGEGRDKAGAYAVQGLASYFVTAIDGSYSNVVGLPVDLLYRLALELGHDLKLAHPVLGTGLDLPPPRVRS